MAARTSSLETPAPTLGTPPSGEATDLRLRTPSRTRTGPAVSDTAHITEALRTLIAQISERIAGLEERIAHVTSEFATTSARFTALVTASDAARSAEASANAALILAQNATIEGLAARIRTLEDEKSKTDRRLAGIDAELASHSRNFAAVKRHTGVNY